MTKQRDLDRIRIFKGVDHLAGGVEGQTRDGDSGTGNVPAKALSLVFLVILAFNSAR